LNNFLETLSSFWKTWVDTTFQQQELEAKLKNKVSELPGDIERYI